jgi:hypothetical protein
MLKLQIPESCPHCDGVSRILFAEYSVLNHFSIDLKPTNFGSF